MHSKSRSVFHLGLAILSFCQIVWSRPELPNINTNLTEEFPHELLSVRSAQSLGVFSAAEDADELESGKISGGSYAIDGQFPFMAVVQRLIGDGLIGQCGGTIISKRWVLTAGHCVAEEPRKFFVVFGVINKSGVGYDFNQGPGESMLTTQGAVHPGYKETTNDIGLLFMPRDIPFSSTIQPIALATHGYAKSKLAGKTSQVIGWGKDRTSSSGTKKLKYATLPIISEKECRKYWMVDNRNICTAPDFGQDACQGDSGGPLIVTNRGRPLQIGIVSYGDSNCPSHKPGVFTKVSAFSEWIKSVTKLQL